MKVEARLREKLTAAFAPRHLEVVNESYKHHVPPGSEAHFKVVLVSDRFEGLSKVKRQQAVYQTLAEDMAGPVHALAQYTYTPAEWARQGVAPETPACTGIAKP